MIRLLFTLFLTALSLTASASKAQRGWTQIRQSDGTYLWIHGYGDENLHWYTTRDSVLLYHEGTDYYVAKTEAQGILSSTGVLAHEPAGRSATEMILIQSQDRSLFFNASTTNIAKAKSMNGIIEENTSAYFPHKGSPKALVILADYNNHRFLYNDKDTREVFEAYLNADGKPTAECDTLTYKKGGVSANFGSVRQYFKDMSFGAFTPQFDVYGPVHLPNDMKYYGDNMSRFIPAVCDLANDQLDIDFSQYDSNGDKKVDLLCVIYAGYSGSISGTPSECIWPKTGNQSAGPYDNGVSVSLYCVVNELNGIPANTASIGHMINGIGLFCHEFSHALGLPDFYPTSSYAQCDNQGMEDWSLLDGGEYVQMGYYPTAYTAWEREALGWMEIETLDKQGTYSMESLTKGINPATGQYQKGKAYRIINDQDAGKNECYILENIQRENWNYALGKAYQRPHGMMITHVNFDASAFKLSANSVNNIKGKPRMTILPADGKLLSSYSDKDRYAENMNGQLYPGKCNVTNFEYSLPARTLTTTEGNDTIVTAYPNSIVYYGSVESMASTKPIKNIRESNSIITFDFIAPSSTSVSHPSIQERQDSNDTRIFSLDGRCVGTDLEALPRGIYLRGGRKYIRH